VYGTCRTLTGSPWSGPFPPPSPQPRGHKCLRLKELCSTASQVILTCPTSRKSTRRDFGLDLPRPDCLRNHTTAPSEISRFPLMKRMHMPQVSDSGEPNEHSHSALLHVAFPIVQQGQHSQKVISELNTAPMHSPANASPRHRCSSRHSSGPEWIATPFSAEDLALPPHLLLHASFNRRFRRGRNAGYPAPPAQIPACTTNALGSYLGCVTQRR